MRALFISPCGAPFLLLCTVALLGCQDDLKAPQDPPGLDRAFFFCQVQNVLTETCSGYACHGTIERYFVVFARNRLRFGIASEDERNSSLNMVERNYNYFAAAAQVDADDPSQSLLLLKPLEMEAGGYFHRGAEIFKGGDVFQTKEDRDFEILAEWVNGKKDDPSCQNGAQEVFE